MSEFYKVFSILGFIVVLIILIAGILTPIFMGKKNLSFPEDDHSRKGYLISASVGGAAYVAALVMFILGSVKLFKSLPSFSLGESDGFFYALFWSSFLYQMLAFFSFVVFLAALIGVLHYSKKND